MAAARIEKVEVGLASACGDIVLEAAGRFAHTTERSRVWAESTMTRDRAERPRGRNGGLGCAGKPAARDAPDCRGRTGRACSAMNSGLAEVEAGGTRAEPSNCCVRRPDASHRTPRVGTDRCLRSGLAGVLRLPARCAVAAGFALPLLMGSAGAQTGDASTNGGICSRTEQVRTAILSKIPGVDACGAVTDAQLAAITGKLRLSGTNISSLQAHDFSGLTSLTSLSLSNNELSALPVGVFSDLTSLRRLFVESNRLETLPAGVFDSLTGLVELRLLSNELRTLPNGVFARLNGLRVLDLEFNELPTLPTGVFAGLDLAFLGLEANELQTLPAGTFSGLNVEALDLSHNDTSALSAEVFDGLTRLRDLDLGYNELQTLPAGVFDGLTNLRFLRLEDNPGSDFTFTMAVERRPGTNKVAVTVAEGAPFDMTTTISATGGALPAGVSTVTVPTGRTRSDEIAVTPLDGATVSLGTAPPVPSQPLPGGADPFNGIATAVAAPVTFGTAVTTNTPATGQPVITGTVQVGETLNASVTQIVDADGLAGAVFSYHCSEWTGTTTRPSRVPPTPPTRSSQPMRGRRSRCG